MATLFIAATLIFVVYNTYPKIHGKLYSGKGISSDIIGASISAYINALNKICFEEA
jgi:hypothetical protein